MNRDTPKTETPESVAAQCIAHRLRLMHRVVMGIYDQALRDEGVDMRVSQMNILVQVMLAGPEKPSDLCEAMKMVASTVTRNVERLIARGWLRRCQKIKLTKQVVLLTFCGSCVSVEPITTMEGTHATETEFPVFLCRL